MATTQDFIPQEAEIEVNPTYIYQDVKNFADGDAMDIISNVIQATTEYEGRYKGQRDPYDQETTGIWNLQDYAFRCGVNDSATQSEKSLGANEPEKWERAKIGSTLFYRQVRQKASNGYAVQTSKDMPFKYVGLTADTTDTSISSAEMRAKKLNLLAKWSMKADNFNHKSIEFWTQVYKYGNIPVLVEWIQRNGRKTVSVPTVDEAGNITGYEEQQFEGIVENRPTFQIFPVESVWVDTAIGDIQSQECVIVTSVVSMTDIIDGIRTGIYREDLIEDIGRAQQWDGTSGGYDNEDNKKRNRGFDDLPTQSGTGQYLKREIFVNLPIDEETGEWDERKNVPKRFRVTMFGNTPGNSAVARIERNQEPDDTIPIAMIHSNPDDSDMIYHISDYEPIRGNMAAETTIKRQLIDNNTLANHPAMWEVIGEVQGNDRSFGPNARYKVETPNSIGTFNIRDLSQSNIPVLQELQEDSNRANSVDKNMLGESFGARTSALEANTIAGNSRRPNLVNIEYVMNQLFGFYAQRLKVLWEAYGRRDQVIQITDENDNIVHIRPDDIAGEYDIIIDIMDDIKDSAVEAQKYTNYIQTVGSVPQLSQTTDWVGLHAEYAEKIFGSSKFVVPAADGDATSNALANVQTMIQTGQAPQIDPSMNLKRHLEVYKEERRRFVGYEDQYPTVTILDQVIQMLEQMVNQPQAIGQQGIATESVVRGQETSGVLGGA